MFGRDFYLPVLFGSGFLLYHSECKGEVVLRLSLRAGLWHGLTCLALCSCLLAHFFLVLRGAAGLWVSLTILLFALMVLSYLNVWLDLPALLSRLRSRGSKLFIPLAAIGLLSVYPRLIEWNWFWLIKATGGTVYYALRALGWNVSLFDMSYSVGIAHRWFRASINMSCSGMEGMTFFVFSYLIYLYTSPDLWSWPRAIGAGAVGLVILFVVNLVRIISFLIIAITLNALGAPGSAFFGWAFHANAGWVMYLAAITIILNYLKHRPHLLFGPAK
jgi:exosortase/archaeosortase family protein